jgi:hypothetical protein
MMVGLPPAPIGFCAIHNTSLTFLRRGVAVPSKPHAVRISIIFQCFASDKLG